MHKSQAAVTAVIPSMHHQLPPVTAPHSQTMGHLPCTPCHLTTDLQQLCQVCLQRRLSILLLTHGFKDTLKHPTEEENYQRPSTVNQPLHSSASPQAFCSHFNPLQKGSYALRCKNFTGFSTDKATEYLQSIPSWPTSPSKGLGTASPARPV